MVRGRISRHGLSRFYWAEYGGTTRNRRPVGNLDVVSDGRLPTYRNAITYNGTAGHPGHPGDDAVFADLHIVSDLDEIINFCPPSDDSTTKGGAVDGGITTDFHVIA